MKPKSLLLNTRSPKLIALLGWLLILMGLAQCVQWLIFIDWRAMDLVQDYMAAQELVSGRSIYHGPRANNHPPFTAILFVPLTLLPPNLAAQLWLIISIGLFFLVGYLIMSELQISPSRPWLLVIIGGGLCWYPFQAHLALGQLSLLVIACLVGCWLLWKRDRNYLAGILLALACLIKLFPGLIFIYLLMRRKWHAFISAFFFTFLGWLATIILIRPENVLHYFLEITPRLAAQQSIFPINVSINGAISRLFVDGPWIEPLFYAPHTARIFWLIIGSGLLALLVWQLWRLPQTDWADTISFAATCLVMLLLSPITWQHIFPLLILPFAILYKSSAQQSEQKSKRLALLLLCVILVSLPDIQIANMVMAVYSPYRMPWSVSLLFLAPTTALLLLWRLLYQIELMQDKSQPLENGKMR